MLLGQVGGMFPSPMANVPIPNGKISYAFVSLLSSMPLLFFILRIDVLMYLVCVLKRVNLLISSV